MKRKLTATNLIGPGVAPVDRAYVEIAPAYPFDDGSATNWDIPVRINLVDGAIPTVDQPLLEDTNDLGDPMTWNIRVVFEDARAKFIGGSRQVAYQLPEGTGDVDYTDLIPAEIVEPPEYGPTYLYQTLAARDETLVLKAATETAAASISKGVPNGVAGLDGDAKVPESQIPTRLSAESLSGTFVTPADLEEALEDFTPGEPLASVYFGTTTTTARPDATVVIWRGDAATPVVPIHAADGDLVIYPETVELPDTWTLAGVTGLTAHYDAQALSQADLAAVATWPNVVPGKPAAVPVGASPTMAVAGINGHRAVQFANNGVMHAAGYADYTGPSTIYVVGAATDAVDDFFCDALDASAAVLKLAVGRSATTYVIQRGTALAGAAANTAPHIIRGVFNGTASSIRVDAGTPTVGTTADSMGAVDIFLGGRASNTNKLTGFLGEYILIRGLVSSGDDAKIMAYLNARWGI